MVVLDTPTADEIKGGLAYSSQSARMLFNDLAKAGIPRSDIHATYLAPFRPPEGDFNAFFHHDGLTLRDYSSFYTKVSKVPVEVLNYAFKELENLKDEIKLVQPDIIICAGKWSLFFLTGETSKTETLKSDWGTLLKWRASQLELGTFWEYEKTHVVIPILPPTAKWKLSSYTSIILQDFNRCGLLYKECKKSPEAFYDYLYPKKKFITAPDYATVREWFTTEILRLNKTTEKIPYAVDCETTAGYLDCVGIAKSSTEAICIPFATSKTPHYWTEEEELNIRQMLRMFLTHPNCGYKERTGQFGQNYWYDMQYFWRFLGINTQPSHDTMVLHHTMFAGLKKNLGFLSSLYARNHKYWKEDGKLAKGKTDEERWIYNCKDCCFTFEIALTLLQILDQSPANIKNAYKTQLEKTLPLVIKMMKRGVRQDLKKKTKLYYEYLDLTRKAQGELNYIIGEDFNSNSSDQKAYLFYNIWKLPRQYDAKTGALTTGKEALPKLIEAEPLVTPLINRISELGQFNTLVGTFLKPRQDIDDRMRCSYNICGTNTFRFSSSEDAFGSGGNLQNIPMENITITGRKLPNVREFFLADEGYTMGDTDLDSADLRIVVAESGAKGLQDMLDAGLKPYIEMMKEYYNDPGKNKNSKEYKTFKGIAHGCLTGEHEVLTKSGWIRIDEVSSEAEIAVWNKETWNIHFEKPSGYYKGSLDSGEQLVQIKGSSFDQTVTLDHTMPGTVDSKKNLKTYLAGQLPKSVRLPYVGNFIGGSEHTYPAKLQLIAALQADGSIYYKDLEGICTFRWHFKKARKVERLLSILKQLPVEYSISKYSDGSTSIYLKGFLESYMKTPGAWLLEYSRECLTAWVEELIHWDGHSKTSNGVRNSISTTCPETAEWIKTVLHLSGKGSKTVTKLRDETRKTLYEVSINNREFYTAASGVKKVITPEKGTKIYCPSTTTGFFMIRKNGHIMVTGNTNYVGSAKGLAQRFGLLTHEVDTLQKWYFGANPELKIWHKELLSQATKRGWIENIFGYRLYIWDKRMATLAQMIAAWKPQSTVGLLINECMYRVDQQIPEVDILMQVHDSFVFQYPTHLEHIPAKLSEVSKIELPYERPIIIPMSFGLGKSWADCK